MTFRVFLDCDGVLADFDKKAIEILGVRPRDYENTAGAEALWAAIDSYDGFFYSLEPMPDAFELYAGVEALGFEPIILTGTPKWSGQGIDPSVQKRLWVNKWFGHNRVITCKSRDKCLHMEKLGDVLIDDWHKYVKNWEDKGGIFILHESAKKSLRALAAYQEQRALM